MSLVGRFALPLTLGGERSLAENTWIGMRAAEGSHVGAEDSLEDEYRKAIATALACADQAAERAALQTFPLYADDLLEGYEDVLGILPLPTQTRTDRRRSASARWHRSSRADLPSLEDELQAINGNITVVHVDVVTSTIPGRRFAPSTLTPAEIVAENVILPNYAGSYIVRVRVPGGVPWEGELLRDVDALLQDALPAWCMYLLQSTAGPFHLGVSGLGRVPFAPP